MDFGHRERWLEYCAGVYEVPVQQVMIAWATYQISCDLVGYMACKVEFSKVVLSRLFQD